MNSFCRHAKTNLWTRTFSTKAPHARIISRPIQSTKFIDILLRETHEPIWRLLKALPTRSVDLPAALDRHGVTAEEYDRWKPIIYEHDISSALDILKRRGLVVHPSGAANDMAYHLPSWVVLYFISYKIRTHQHAALTSMDITYSHLSVAPAAVQGPLLILTLLNLARFNLLVPLRQVVDTFLITNLDHPSIYFNLILQALSYVPTRSIQSANSAVSILKSMDSRQLKLSSPTYEMLLRDRFVTVQLTKYLRERMTREGFVPKAAHLEAYLRVFAKHGAVHDAWQYHQAIRAQASTATSPSSEPVNLASDPVHRANTLFLGAYEDRASAFHFLRTLVMSEGSPTERDSHQTSPSIGHPPQRHSHKEPDIYGYTVALSVAARDRSASDTALVRLFERMQARLSSTPPTVVSYTILIRGLLSRKSSEARLYWEKFYNSGLALDKQSLSLGLQVLTRNSEPHRAFALLEKHASKGTGSGTCRLHPPVTLTSISMNDFLVSLNRIARPDMVFKLWDHMGELYGIFPDARTLSILLQSARLSRRLNDTVSGALAQLALKNLFRQPDAPFPSRESIVESITAIVGTPETGIIPYKPRAWQNQVPVDRALHIFQQVIFGNAPKTLIDVVPPAHAIRSSVNDDPMGGLGMPKFGPIKATFAPPPDLLSDNGHSRYPHIVVTNENCFNYIVLLGLTSRATEIPLTLAWMRELCIQPSSATLALALVFWSEVSVQAPLVETWTGGAERSEYAKLRDWIEEWVGPGRVPDERLMGEWHQKVAKLRQGIL